MFKKLMGTAVVVLACAVVPLVAATVVDRTVATVNNEAIMKSEFDKMIAPVMEQYTSMAPADEQTPEKITELKTKLINQMVDDRLLKQEAKKRKLKVTKRDIDQGVAQVKKRFPGDAEFQAELKKENISETQFIKRIEDQLVVMKLIEQEIKAKTTPPTDEDVKSFYEQVQQKMAGKELGLDARDEEEIAGLAKMLSRLSSEQARARHILITVEKDADMQTKTAALNKIKSIEKELKAGGNFIDLAKKYSEDPGSKSRGGDLGFFAKGDMVPAFEKAAFALNVGQVSAPVLTDFGYHLILLEQKRAGQKPGFDDVKNDLKEVLYQKNAQKRYDAWLKDLRAKANVKINALD